MVNPLPIHLQYLQELLHPVSDFTDSPVVLIFSVDPTFSGLARLPKTLKESGFEVIALCSPKAFLAKTRYLNHRLPISNTKSSIRLLQQLSDAIDCYRPSFLILGDEMTVALVHHVIQNLERFQKKLPDSTLKFIQSSLGDPQYFEATLLKHRTLELAQKLGLRVPAMASVTQAAEAQEFAEKIGYPIVLKKDFGCSGVGVEICRNEAEFLTILPSFLPRPQSSFKTIVRKQLQRDWFPQEKTLSLQQYVQGKTAMYPVVAVDGEILASFAAIKEETCSETGPSSVIHLVNHAEMQATATALIQKFHYTGFASFDFLIQDKTQHAYLLECNPRPVPVCHLGALGGVNLAQALFAHISGQHWEPQTRIKQEETIALFPQEWKRNPTSPNLSKFYHDVPWDDPELLKAYVG